MRIAVFGLGYVGTVTAAVLSSNGHEVRAVDVDDSKVSAIANGTSPVVEAGLDDLIKGGVRSGSLRATVDSRSALEGAELSLICVGTPSSNTGSTDLQFVMRAVEDITRILRDEPRRFHSIVIRSTVPPGTVEDVIRPLVDQFQGSTTNIGVGMCPEFLREGTAVADFYNTPFNVLGTFDSRVADAVESLFAFLDEPLRVVSPRVAESIKYACNAFHATKVSFANEMGRLLRELGVDSREVMKVFCSDTKLNISAEYLAPGFAFGGSCLPKDLRSLLYLARTSFLDLPLLSGVLSTNALAINCVIDRVVESGVRSVALFGLSFKSSSDDLRESPYVVLAEALIGKGYDLRVYDPIVEPSKLIGTNRQYVNSKLPHLKRILTSDPATALDGADLVLVGTTDKESLDAVCAARPAFILDLNGRLGERIESLPGYEGVAWERSAPQLAALPC
jgi:GDP-mannose 6-dehydrogenase